MTTGPRSQCDTCARYRSFLETDVDGPSCEAFPEGIPDRIFRNGVDHRQPAEGDHDLQWIPAEGETFPEWAFLPEFLAR